MSLTFGQAKNILAQYQGKGGKEPTAPQLDLFTKKVLQYLLVSGAEGSERTFTFTAVNGCFTAPPDLDVPLKVLINGRVGNVGSKWFEFRSGSESFNDACSEATDVLVEEANEYYTAYDLPAGGGQIGVLGTAEEDCDACIIIAGNDGTGREIYTNHKGVQIAGERLSIVKGQMTWSNVTFANIVSIVKTKTNGYTPLWFRSGPVKGFLADYSPAEEVPNYRRFRLKIGCPELAKISILGRVKIKETYGDNERIPFDMILPIEVAGQQVNAGYNEKMDVAAAKDNFLMTLNNRDANFKKVNNGQPLEFFYELSAGTIKGIV